MPVADEGGAVNPSEGVAAVGPLVLAIADYEIPGKGFLPLRANDVVSIIETDASGWWLGMNLAGRKGVLPSTYTVPYVFPAPRADTVAEVELIKLAKDYGVDLASGVPVVPANTLLHSRASILPAAERACLSTMEDLYRATDAAILTRETIRAKFVASLKALRQAKNSAGATQRSAAMLEHHTSAKCLGEAEEACETLAPELDALVRSLAALKEKCECAGAECNDPVPPHAWYQRVSAALANAPMVDPSLLETFSDAGEVRDVKRAVLEREQRLTELASEVKAAEARYRDEKASIQARIERRDASISEMLTWWADRAEEARTDYLAAKAQLLREAEQGQLEVNEMHHELEMKRHQFTCLAAELDEVRVAAKEVKRALNRKGQLADLEARIEAANRRIAEATREERGGQAAI